MLVLTSVCFTSVCFKLARMALPFDQTEQVLNILISSPFIEDLHCLSQLSEFNYSKDYDLFIELSLNLNIVVQ
jgi:hypothetical protein